MASSLQLPSQVDVTGPYSAVEQSRSSSRENGDEGAFKDNCVPNTIPKRKLLRGKSCLTQGKDSMSTFASDCIENTAQDCILLDEGQEATSEYLNIDGGTLERSKALLSEDSVETKQTGEQIETRNEEIIRDNVINFDPTGFSSTPREPENLSVNAKEALAELLEDRGRTAGRPHRIPGTLAQSKVVRMLLDTGAASSLMPHKLFLELKRFKPSLTLASTKQTLHGVDGGQLRVYGIAVVDVEFAGQFVLWSFTVVDMVDECILGMDFLRLNNVQWDLGKGELRIGENATVYSQHVTIDPTIPSCRAQLVKRTFVPASSLAKVEVSFRHRGMALPSPGVITAVGSTANKYGVVLTRAIIDPGTRGTCTVMVMNPTEHAVDLPQGMTVGVLEPVVSLQATNPDARTSGFIDSVSSLNANDSDESDNSSVGEESSGYDGSSEASASSLVAKAVMIVDESPNGMPEKAAAPRPCSDRCPPVESSPPPTQDRGVSDPGDLSETVGVANASQTDEAKSFEMGEDYVPEHLQKLYDATACELDEVDCALVRQVLRRNADIFAKHSTDLGSTRVATHSIDTGDSRPIKQAPRRVAIHRQAVVKQEVESMLEKGIIEPSEGPWSSPIVLAKKKDGTLRFCIDYRKLNDVTRKDAYPLPRIEDNLDTLSGSTWFSTLDLISGFWQVEMDAKDRVKTAFSSGVGGLYQFRRMPFGLCNAPATFQRLMEKVLAGLQWQIAVLYIDDIVVYGSSVDEHLERLEILFDRLRKAGLKLKPSKCTLLRRKVDFLGHTVSAEGVEADSSKISKVTNWPTPVNVSEVRSFIGLCAYYRRFVKGFSDLCKPLYRLTEKGVTFCWGKEQETAFNALKERLTTAPILAFPNGQDMFILDTDASDVGVGAVLSQLQGGYERVIAYGSRVLSKTERNYCVTRRELLAIVVFVKMFHHYLVGSQFLLRTDHAALYWLFGMKNLEGQPARWVERLGCYDMVILHRLGGQHGNADALSRCPQRCKETRMLPGPSGSEMDLADFQAIQCYVAHDKLDQIEVDLADSDWSDDQWDDENEPLIPDYFMAQDHEAGDVQPPCICHVLTRAQMRMIDTLDAIENPPPAEIPVRLQCDDSTPEAQMPTVKVSTDPKRQSDPEPTKVGEATPDRTETKLTKRKRRVGRPRLDQGPSSAEILELQKQQEFLRNIPPFNWTDDEIAHMQIQDHDVAKLRQWVENKKKPIWQDVAKESRTLKTWWGRFEQLYLSKNRVLYLVWEHDTYSYKCPIYRIVTPLSLRPHILRELHDTKTAGHMGIRKTRARAFMSRYFWPGMSDYVKRWVTNCLKCGARKKPQYSRRQPMQTYYVGAKLDTVSIDILGPFKPRTSWGNVYILTITDHFTRWVNAYPLRDATAAKIARCVVDFISQFGVPKHLHSDQGSNVDGSVIGEVCKILGISKTHTCPWHPQGNAITERENKVIVDMLSHYVNVRQTDWDQCLPVVMLAYRSSVHRVLGESPAAMMYGHELRLPIDAFVGPPPEAEHEVVASSDYVQKLADSLQTAHATVRERLESHYRYEKKQYDHKIQEQHFAVGQAVWLRNFPKTTTKSKKLMKPYSGPHIVIAIVNAVTYKIKLSRATDKVVHGDRLKPFYGAVSDPCLKKLWVPLAKGLTVADDTGAYEGVAPLFDDVAIHEYD